MVPVRIDEAPRGSSLSVDLTLLRYERCALLVSRLPLD
jgi:hypothetical protein